jgi:hypothetical protein
MIILGAIVAAAIQDWADFGIILGILFINGGDETLVFSSIMSSFLFFLLSSPLLFSELS